MKRILTVVLLFLLAISLAPRIGALFTPPPDTTMDLRRVAGGSGVGYGGDGGPALLAGLSKPYGLSMGMDGSLFIADSGNNVIRKVDPAGTITTIAGTGIPGFSGDEGPAVRARLSTPMGICLSNGALLVADSGNHRIRRIGSDGAIVTIAGSGGSGFEGDGGPAVFAQLNNPRDVCSDSAGNVYIADSGNHRVRVVNAAGTILTFAGNGKQDYQGDGDKADSASLDSPASLAVNVRNEVYIADFGNHVVRRVNNAGIITTVAGTGRMEIGIDGEGQKATACNLGLISGIALDWDDNLIFVDQTNYCIRRVDQQGIVATIAKNPPGYRFQFYPPQRGDSSREPFVFPARVTTSKMRVVYVSDMWVSHVIKLTDQIKSEAPRHLGR